MPSAHNIMLLYILFVTVSFSVLLDNGAAYNFIAAPQVIKTSINLKNSLMCPFKPIKVHLLNFFFVISHQIMHLSLKFSDGA